MSALAFIFSPGVLLHEGSHYLAARLLGVRTGRFSIRPAVMTNGSIRMGYVETQRVDIFRNTLIGAAPLVAGGFAISLIGTILLQTSMLFNPDTGIFPAFFSWLQVQISHPRFWIGLYLAVTISSMMVPSPSDRRDWLAFGLILASLVLVLYLVGAWGWLQGVFSPLWQRLLNALAGVFAVSLLVHALALPPVFLLRKLLEKLV